MVKPVKMMSESRQILAPITTAATSPEAQQILDEAISEAATVDGDRVLDQFEAEAIKLAFEAVAPQDGSEITADVAADIKGALLTRVAAMKAERVNSTEVLFTSEGEALTNFRGKITGAMKDTIKKAAGKQVDINLMLFAFTDKVMADEIVSIAAANPNVTFRLLTDWSQMASSGGRQASRLAKLVEKDQIPNIVVKFKKDNPYIWDSVNNRPKFSHGHTKGLNHHKGFVTLIDGRPEKMAMGSFNWSVSAMKSNYENMMLLDRADPDNRRIMKGYEKEFEGFWNRDDSALLFNEARKVKNRLYEALYEAHGQSYTGFNVPDDTIADPVFVALDASTAFDINSFSDEDNTDLQALVGKTLASRIHKELREYGRLDPVNAVNVRDLVDARRAEGVTTLITTHDMLIADALCDRVGFILDGELVECDAPAALKRRYGTREVVVSWGHEDEPSTARFPLDGIGGQDEFLRILRDEPVLSLHSQETTLEDVFVQVTGRTLK